MLWVHPSKDLVSPTSHPSVRLLICLLSDNNQLPLRPFSKKGPTAVHPAQPCEQAKAGPAKQAGAGTQPDSRYISPSGIAHTSAPTKPLPSPYQAPTKPLPTYQAPTNPTKLLPSPYQAPTKPLPSPYQAPTKPLPSPYQAPTKPLPSPYLAPTKPLPSPYQAPT